MIHLNAREMRFQRIRDCAVAAQMAKSVSWPYMSAFELEGFSPRRADRLGNGRSRERNTSRFSLPFVWPYYSPSEGDDALHEPSRG